MRFNQFFSLDSPKAIKARKYGYMNAINYMAPADTAGVGDMCPWSSAGCRALCLGEHSGQASMVSRETGTNACRESRKEKTRMFMRERARFMRELDAGIARAERKATREGFKLCVRLNGATDLNWTETIKRYPHIQFVDYTKSVKRALAHAAGKLPANYHLTFSRSETNWDDCVKVLCAGGNVAVVFATKPDALYRGWTVVDGDSHDLRHLDSKGYHSGEERKSLIIALSPKGNKAKKDTSGFVVR